MTFYLTYCVQDVLGTHGRPSAHHVRIWGVLLSLTQGSHSRPQLWDTRLSLHSVNPIPRQKWFQSTWSLESTKHSQAFLSAFSLYTRECRPSPRRRYCACELSWCSGKELGHTRERRHGRQDCTGIKTTPDSYLRLSSTSAHPFTHTYTLAGELPPGGSQGRAMKV